MLLINAYNILLSDPEGSRRMNDSACEVQYLYKINKIKIHFVLL